MAITAKPEVLRPRARATRQSSKPAGEQPGGNLFADRNLDLLSHLLDDFLRIPGTPIRFGLDGIVGFIPGIGDLLGGLASTILIVAAWSRGVPNVVVARMVLNVAIETAAGSIPILGNLFDIGWRANRRNYALLTRATAAPQQRTAGHWLFIAGICLLLAIILAIPFVLGGWLLIQTTATRHPKAPLKQGAP